MSRVSAPPKPQTPGQADPPLRPRKETGRSKFKTWRRRPSRLGAFTWEKWWRVFWAILPWLAFLRSLTILGLGEVELSNSARLGLKNAIAAMLCMCCSLDPRWQRCRAHFRANPPASCWARILLTGEYRGRDQPYHQAALRCFAGCDPTPPHPGRIRSAACG